MANAARVSELSTGLVLHPVRAGASRLSHDIPTLLLRNLSDEIAGVSKAPHPDYQYRPVAG